MVTSTFKTEAFKSESGEVFLVLLTIDQDDLVSPIRVVNNNEDITSGGDLYVAFPFEIELPNNLEDSPPRSRLTIDNISREIAQAIRTMTSAATVVIEVIRAADPDTIEATFAPFIMKNVKWNMFHVSGDLVLENMENEPFPAGEFSAAYFPGLF